MSLSPAQRDAVLCIDRHLMIEAGAGSGKTTTLIEKILYETGLSSDHEAPPHRVKIDEILAVTFTRKAAGEIKDRLRRRIFAESASLEGAARERMAVQGFRIDDAEIGTIDRLASRIVRDYGPYAGVDAGYQLLDETDAELLRLEVAGEQILDAVDRADPGAVGLVRHFGFLQTRRFVSDALERPDLLQSLRHDHRAGRLGLAALQGGANRVDELIAPIAAAALEFLLQVLGAFQRRLVREGVLDFASMAQAAAKVVRSDEARQEIAKKVRLLVVDEHQDTSPLQSELLFALAGLPRPGREAAEAESPPWVRMVLIGDPKQSIYSFRHADILQWQRSRTTVESAGGQYISLDRSFRSTPVLTSFHDEIPGRILADRSLRPYDVNYEPLEPTRSDIEDAPVEVLLASEPSTPEVASLVAVRIREMLDRGERICDRHTGGLREVVPGDIAILARELKRDAVHYICALHDQRIDFRLVGGGGLYQRQEVLDVAALLSAVADPHNPFALAAYLRSPFGAVDDQTIHELAVARTEGRSTGSLFDALRRADRVVSTRVGKDRAREALALLRDLRELRDRIGHDELIRKGVKITGYEAFLAGAPDAPLGLRNLSKLIKIAASAESEPLYSFVEKLSARIAQAEREQEAPLYASDENLVTLSTIHSAKGLEWPIVIFTQLHEHVVRSVRRDSGPRLSPRLGVVLPLDVVLREGGHQTRIPEPSRLWEVYEQDHIAQEYAEAKRLFYVAATRARDRLILAGALKDVGGYGLVSQSGYRTSDTLDRWLQVLIPELAGAEEPTTLIDHREVPLWVLRPGAAVAARRATDPERDWPHAIPELGEVPAAEGEDVLLLRTRPVAPGPLRTEFAVSEFLQFAICPHKHYFGYRAGISSPRLEATPDATIVSRILPERRGDILHHYLGQHEDSWSEDKMRAELKRILLWHIPMEEAQAEANVGELLGQVKNYLKSDVHIRVRAARERGGRVYREVPFVYRFRPDVRVRGVLDLLFEEEDGWTAVDYKTGLFGEEEADHEETVRVRTERYKIQAAIYSLAVMHALQGVPLQRFHFFFTPPGLDSAIPITEEWPASARDEVLTTVQRIRASEYGEPTFAVERCVGCEYRAICRPAGAE